MKSTHILLITSSKFVRKLNSAEYIHMHAKGMQWYKCTMTVRSHIPHCQLEIVHTIDQTRRYVLEPRVSPAFAITYFCNHCNIRFENTSKYVDTLTLFSKNLNHRSLTPRWPLTPCLLQGRNRHIFLRGQSHFSWFFSRREMLFPGR